jgi:transposase-like protein
MQPTSKQTQMFSIVQEYLKGEQSIKQICQKYQITKDSLSYWQQKYKRLSASHAVEFVAVKVTEPVSSSQPITITYPNQVSITIDSITNLQFIKSLILIM